LRVRTVILCALAVAGCAKPLREEECVSLVDRYTALLLKEEKPAAAPAEVARAQTAARDLLRREPRFQLATCSRRIQRSSFECAMQAPSVDEMERCLVF
jgi:hypothetical protein